MYYWSSYILLVWWLASPSRGSVWGVRTFIIGLYLFISLPNCNSLWIWQNIWLNGLSQNRWGHLIPMCVTRLLLWSLSGLPMCVFAGCPSGHNVKLGAPPQAFVSGGWSTGLVFHVHCVTYTHILTCIHITHTHTHTCIHTHTYSHIHTHTGESLSKLRGVCQPSKSSV